MAHHIAALVLAALVAPSAMAQSAVNAGTESGQRLRAPKEVEEFSFVIFGDRTGGPREGIAVLEEAVVMANRLGPAFVMTVGDMVEGYNTPKTWLREMREYKGIMDRLDGPWYPVVGNHDVYARPARTNGAAGHVNLYKKHFGPLYYSFDYQWAHFVCLFSDEKLSFSNPAVNQNVGPEQMQWLRDDLAATDAEQIFVFLHHPRWNYAGTNWDEVHRMFAEDGRVRSVFAGHIHEYRDDGVRDGIHYYALAVTGGHQSGLNTASFHHVNLVRLRRSGMVMCALPIGMVLGSDVVLGAEVDTMHGLARGAWIETTGRILVDADGGRRSRVAFKLRNPTDRPVRYALNPVAPASWKLAHKVLSGTLAPGRTVDLPVEVTTTPLSAGDAPRLEMQATLQYPLVSGLIQDIRAVRAVPVQITGLDALAAARPRANHVLALDGKSAVRVDLGRLDDLETFTLEAWVRGAAPKGRQGLINKTESSGIGIFWSEAGAGRERPTGYVHLQGRGYLTAEAEADWRWDEWTHVAVTYDGERLRLFVNGRVAGEDRGAGTITPNAHPLFIGADPNQRGAATSFFTGEIDEVRLSAVARYRETFTPPAHHERDAATLLLLHFDVALGAVFPDDSGREHHGWAVGAPAIRSSTRAAAPPSAPRRRP